MDSARPHWCHWLLSFRAHGVAAIREIGKTGGFENFEIETNPSEVVFLVRLSCMHHALLNHTLACIVNWLYVYRYCNVKTLSSARYMWFLVLETRKSLVCRRRDPASLRGKHNMTPCSAPRPVQKQNSEPPTREMPSLGMRPWTIGSSPAALVWRVWARDLRHMNAFFHARTGRDTLEYSISSTCNYWKATSPWLFWGSVRK